MKGDTPTCPICDNNSDYELHFGERDFSIGVSGYIYICLKCEFKIWIHNREEAIKMLFRKRNCYLNEIKLTMWD